MPDVADVARMDAARLDVPPPRDVPAMDLVTFDRPDIVAPTDTVVPTDVFTPTDAPSGMCPSTCMNSAECQASCPSIPAPAAYCCLSSTCVYVADGLCSGPADVTSPGTDAASGDSGTGGGDSGGGCGLCAVDSDCTRCGKSICVFGTCI